LALHVAFDRDPAAAQADLLELACGLADQAHAQGRAEALTLGRSGGVELDDRLLCVGVGVDLRARAQAQSWTPVGLGFVDRASAGTGLVDRAEVTRVDCELEAKA